MTLRSVLVVALIGALLLPGVGEAKKKKRPERSPAELLNVFLGPGYSQWLRGAISYIADDEEIEAYLALQDDDRAAAFIEEFWKRHDPHPGTPANPVRKTFDERSDEADKLYTESTIPGRSTDRGTIFIVYGAPSKTHYDIASSTRTPMPGRNTDQTVETWTYDKGAEPGLDGRPPQKQYRFARDGDLTRFYTGRPGTRIQRPTQTPGEF